MSYYTRLSKAFEDALHLPLTPDSKYILMSDCHRGNGTSTDNFLKNQNLFFAALQYYYMNNFTYIELGDGDELWENRSMTQIINIHSNTFWLMSKFYEENRLYLIYGNHDIMKSFPGYTKRNCTVYYCPESRNYTPLLPGIKFYEGLILDVIPGIHDVYLAHGHQADFFNTKLWHLSRFLVRYLWRPLEYIGILDPTSAAKNNIRKRKIEQNLSTWAKNEGHILITGHTHRPMLADVSETPFFNTGSCVHPRCITGIEIEKHCFTLVKWTYCTRKDFTVAICREVLAGPICINEY